MYYLICPKRIVQSQGFATYSDAPVHRKEVDPCDVKKWDVCYSTTPQPFLQTWVPSYTESRMRQLDSRGY